MSIIRFSLSFACATYALALNTKELLGDEKLSGDEPKYWQAILGDICQLPSFPRATGDPQRYVECVKQSIDTSDRKDLGIWLLRECLPGYEFVASARRCKTTRSIKKQQALCDGPNATNYQFCPSKDQEVVYTVEEIRQPPRQCTCPNGEDNCVCPVPEILEPMMVSKKNVKRAPQMGIQNCPCPQGQSNCVCLNIQTQQPQVFNDACCQPVQQPQQQQQPVQQQNPCLCPATVQYNPPQTQQPQTQPSYQPPPQTGGVTAPGYPNGEPGTIPPYGVHQPQNDQPQQYQPPHLQQPMQQPQQQQQPQPSYNANCPPQPSCDCPPGQMAQSASIFTSTAIPVTQPSVGSGAGSTLSPNCPIHVCICVPPGTQVIDQTGSTPSPQQPQYQPQQPMYQPQAPCQTTTTQQQYCPSSAQQQPEVVQPQPCPLVQGGVQNARYQGICSWMIDPLATDPESQTHFLQCQPAPNNLFCGRWQRMPCAPATKFDAQAQVCVWDSNGNQPGNLPTGNLPTPSPYTPIRNPAPQGCQCTGGVQIGSCNSNYQCPGQSVCQVGQQPGMQRPCMVCCYYHKKTKKA